VVRTHKLWLDAVKRRLHIGPGRGGRQQEHLGGDVNEAMSPMTSTTDGYHDHCKPSAMECACKFQAVS
jgi:hypothetical protein